MRVLLKLRLDCPPEAAWRALQSPAVMREVAGPFLDYVSLEASGFPITWDGESHPATLKVVGVPLGAQAISPALDTERHPGVAVLRDGGGDASGLPAVFRRWDHRMAVSRHPDDPAATLYRDRLIYDAGPLTLPMWPELWALWQWRGLRLQQLAPSFDELAAPAEQPE